jgi:hypothetical protein
MSDIDGGQGPSPAGISWQSVVEAGLAAAAVGFLYWCLQAGFWGAFSVGPAEVGIDVGTPTELAIGYAYVGTALAGAFTLAMVVVRALRRKGKWPALSPRTLLPLLTASFLIAGLIFQGALDGALDEWRTTYPVMAILVGALLVAVVRWPAATPPASSANVSSSATPAKSTPAKNAPARRVPAAPAAAAPPSPNSPIVTMIVVFLALAASGMAINSWGYHVGLRFRTADPSVGTFLIGRTPTCAFVRWNEDSSPPEGFNTEERYKLILLAESGDDFRLYERPFDVRPDPPEKAEDDLGTCSNRPPQQVGKERLADLVYKVSADDVQVDRIPKDRVSGHTQK